MHLERPMSAVQAMDLSEREDRIVWLRYSSGLAAALFADCDSHAASATDEGHVHEYWGKTWRVHLYEPNPGDD